MLSVASMFAPLTENSNFGPDAITFTALTAGGHAMHVTQCRSHNDVTRRMPRDVCHIMNIMHILLM